MIQVSSVPATAVAEGFEQVQVNRRDSKENGTVPQAERCRAIVIPELQVSDVPSKFQMLILDALRNAASAQLAAFWKDAGWPGLSQVPAAVWTVDSILMFAARDAESKRLSKESVLAWFKASKLFAFLASKNNAKLSANWEKRILSLSAPKVDLSEDQCNVTLATIGKFDEDATSMIGAQLVAKLAARIKKLAEEEMELEGLTIEDDSTAGADSV